MSDTDDEDVRITLRLPKALHQRLSQRAEDYRESINSQIVSAIELTYGKTAEPHKLLNAAVTHIRRAQAAYIEQERDLRMANSEMRNYVRVLNARIEALSAKIRPSSTVTEEDP